MSSRTLPQLHFERTVSSFPQDSELWVWTCQVWAPKYGSLNLGARVSCTLYSERHPVCTSPNRLPSYCLKPSPSSAAVTQQSGHTINNPLTCWQIFLGASAAFTLLGHLLLFVLSWVLAIVCAGFPFPLFLCITICFCLICIKTSFSPQPYLFCLAFGSNIL